MVKILAISGIIFFAGMIALPLLDPDVNPVPPFVLGGVGLLLLVAALVVHVVHALKKPAPENQGASHNSISAARTKRSYTFLFALMGSVFSLPIIILIPPPPNAGGFDGVGGILFPFYILPALYIFYSFVLPEDEKIHRVARVHAIIFFSVIVGFVFYGLVARFAT